MRIPAYLRRSRHGVFYFRIAVPLPLRTQWGCGSEIKLSLRTRNQRRALGCARDLAIAAQRSFEYAYGDMTAKPFDPNDVTTWPTAEGIRRFEKTIETTHPDGRIERMHVKADPNSAIDIAAARAEVAKHYKRQRMALTPNSAEAQAFFQAEDEEIRRDLEHTERVRAAFLATQQRGHAQLEPSDPSTRHSPSTTEVAVSGSVERKHGPARAAESSAGNQARRLPANNSDYKKSTLLALWPRFLASKEKVKMDLRSKDTYQMKFDVFIDWFGDSHIEDVTFEDISEYKDYLLHEKVVGGGPRRGQIGLDAPTVDNYIGVLNGLFDWAQKSGYFSRNMLVPTTDQRMLKKADKKARALSGKVNRAFKTHELIQAFETQKYVAENQLSHHYWPPLIALFTGMRLSEVSQLACGDVRVEEGIWAIDINDEDYKNVKSAAGRRIIPMHPELVALGLPVFVEDVKALGLGPQLFPVLAPKVDGSIGNAPGKKWDRYLKAVGLTDDALTYHSFRRTANTLLKRAKVPFDVRCQMVGHDLDHVNESYATAHSVGDLAELVLPKFVFPGLNLAGLRYEEGRFDASIRSGFEQAFQDAKRRREAKEKRDTD